MAKSVTKFSSSASLSPMTAALQHVLKDTYALYLLTHNYHWNIEGPKFVGLHTLFEQHYNELFLAIDTIAERIRALGAYALPDHYGDILEGVRDIANPLHKETDKDKIADRMIQNLIVLHENVVRSAQLAKKAAVKASDDESEDMMIARIQVHQKAIWMLGSIIK